LEILSGGSVSNAIIASGGKLIADAARDRDHTTGRCLLLSVLRTHVRHRARSEKCHERKSPSFNYLVGADKERGRDCQPNGLSGDSVQQQFEPARLNHGKIGNAGAF
jgi:hypothetical protein